MQTLLNDIELDIQELKCLMQAISTDTNPVLRIVAKRNIHQMQEKLEALVKQLDETFVITPAVPDTLAMPDVSVTETVSASEQKVVAEEQAKVEVSPDPVPNVVTAAAPILAERIKPATDLRHAISLNDSFRFARELFNGDAVRMNEVMQQLGEAASLEKALDIFISTVHPDEENEATTDFIELLKKYFN
ncbi:hypothetical protein [Bacteroides cutis]|jgi:hypothetical protein|uniref:hypothetical protein n=1 Tax=Bacteroides cutis TaxID=2024197 RepID=UPI000C759CCC|nr:hypothetical protein [Bacteroides cutis]